MGTMTRGSKPAKNSLVRRRLARVLLLPALAIAACLAVWATTTFDYDLSGPGPTSNTGRHLLALPSVITNPSISDCGDLEASIPNAISVERLSTSTDTLIPGYSCHLPDSLSE